MLPHLSVIEWLHWSVISCQPLAIVVYQRPQVLHLSHRNVCSIGVDMPHHALSAWWACERSLIKEELAVMNSLVDGIEEEKITVRQLPHSIGTVHSEYLMQQKVELGVVLLLYLQEKDSYGNTTRIILRILQTSILPVPADDMHLAGVGGACLAVLRSLRIVFPPVKLNLFKLKPCAGLEN